MVCLGGLLAAGLYVLTGFANAAAETPAVPEKTNNISKPNAEVTPLGAVGGTPSPQPPKLGDKQPLIPVWKAIGGFHERHLVWAIIPDVMAFLVLTSLTVNAVTRCGMYSWYPCIVIALLLWTGTFGSIDYFWVFLLGMATALAEIISKFPDEPLKSLKTGHAVAYHAFNGLIAALALYLIIVFGEAPKDPAAEVKRIFVAGLGAMLAMRSKLFNIKVGGDDVSFGPEQIVKIFLSFMEEAIDRIRSRDRIVFLKVHIDKLDFARFEEIADYITAMLRSSQTRSAEEKNRFERSLAEISALKGQTNRNKCYGLGFELLNIMGENFAVETFTNMPCEFRKAAPSTLAQVGTGLGSAVLGGIAKMLGAAVQASESQFYMAYGTDMSGARFRERLEWSEKEFEGIPAPKKGVLSGYKLAFNKPDKATGTAGFPNLVPDEKDTVQGVVYTLSKQQVEFLDKVEAGYTRKKVSVMVDNKPLDVEVYLAAAVNDSLKPSPIAFSDVIKGAKEHELSPDYITKLEKLAPPPDNSQQTATPSVPTGPNG